MLTQNGARLSRTGARLVSTKSTIKDAQPATSVDTSRRAADNAVVPPPQRSSLTSAFRAGTGGRMSYSGNIVTVFGGYGVLGTRTINRIAKDGTQIVVPYRCDPYMLRDLKTSGDLGQILFFPFELRDDESIRKAMKYSNVVVNLIGQTYETKNYSFNDVHAEGPRRLARIAREMGVDRFVHVSKLGASHTPPAKYVPGGSEILRSKAAGEDAVRDEFPSATIIRPAQTYGYDDSLLRVYMNLVRGWMGGMAVELHEGGENTYKMPVYNTDVSSGIARVVADRSWEGQTLEFVGPHCLKLSEMVNYVQRLVNDPGLSIRRGYGISTHLNVALQEWWARHRIYRPNTTWEFIETFEANSDRLTGVPTLGDVIGQKNLHHFEWSARHWPVENVYGWDDRRHFTDEAKGGNSVGKINHYPILYENEVDDEGGAYERSFGMAA